MRRFLIISSIALILATGATVFTPTVHAQYSTAEDAAASSNQTNIVSGYSSAPSTQAPTTGVNNQTDYNKSIDSGYNGVMIKIMELFAWLVGVAALTLNYAVFYTVVTMGKYVNQLTAVGVAWRILRDLANIMLIFGFIGAGIATILNVEKYGWSTKMIPMLLIAAVSLNFSLFVSEAMVDASNLFATQFYTQINGGTLPTRADSGLLVTSSGTTLTTANEGISNKIMAQLGLQTIYGDAIKPNTAIFQGGNSWLIGFMGILLFLVTAFVMFSLAFILIMRFVTLILLIVFSPVGFMGLAIPQMQYRAGQWWEHFLNQIITAPVLLLLLYVALAIITDVHFLTGFGTSTTGNNGWTGFVQNANIPGFASMVLSFIVAIALLMVVVIKAKSMSAFGADWATKTAGRLTGALSFSAISLAGRGTLGLGGRMLNNKRMQARAAEGGVRGTFAKLEAFTGRNLEKRTFDVRNIPGVRTAGSAMGVHGSNFDKVFAGKATVTAKQAVDKTIEGYKYVKPFSGDWWRNQKQEYEKAAAAQERKSTIAGAAVPPGSVAVAAQKELKKMSVDELAQLKGIRDGINNLVFNLSPEKFNELMKSDKLLAGEKTKLKATWDTQFTVANAATTMSRFDTDQIVSLGGGTLLSTDPTVPGSRPVIDTLGVNEFEAIRRKGSLDRTQRHDIHAHMMAAPPTSALGIVVADYFNAVNDVGGNRKKYWNV